MRVLGGERPCGALTDLRGVVGRDGDEGRWGHGVGLEVGRLSLGKTDVVVGSAFEEVLVADVVLHSWMA